MIRIFWSLLCLCSSIISAAQNNQKIPPFIIQGKLANYPLNQVYLAFKQGHRYIIDTAEVQANGEFHLESYKVTKPANAFLFYGQNNLFPSLYVAPGYHLIVSVDTKNFFTTRTITGVGSETNRFILIRDSFITARSAASWNEMNEGQLLSFVKTNQHLLDSAYQIVFKNKSPADKWFGYFKRMVWLDNKFKKLYFLINHAIDNNAFTSQKTVSFVADNFDSNILSDLYNREYMISDEYRLVMSDYPLYLNMINCRNGLPQCATIKNYNVRFSEIIAGHYKGDIKQMKLFDRMSGAIRNSRSFEELNLYKTNFPRYISMLQKKEDREELDSAIVQKEIQLLKTQIGLAAPLFTATDTMGIAHSIESFKGKVIYLDLWASWCLPCREQTPYLKAIVEKYKNDSSIVFISVAVLDKIDKWKDALIKDTPTWLQLFDNDAIVQRAYVANSIPKFILIDKKGNIVNFDTPPPNSGVVLENILNQELQK